MRSLGDIARPTVCGCRVSWGQAKNSETLLRSTWPPIVRGPNTEQDHPQERPQHAGNTRPPIISAGAFDGNFILYVLYKIMMKSSGKITEKK